MVSINKKVAGVAVVGAAAAAIGLGVSQGARADDATHDPHPDGDLDPGRSRPGRARQHARKRSRLGSRGPPRRHGSGHGHGQGR